MNIKSTTKNLNGDSRGLYFYRSYFHNSISLGLQAFRRKVKYYQVRDFSKNQNRINPGM